MYAQFSQMPFQTCSQSQSQFNNEPITQFIEKSFLKLPQHLSSSLLSNQNLQQKLQEHLSSLKQANQKMVYTNTKYEPKIKETTKTIEKYEKLIEKIEPMLIQLNTSLRKQFGIISNQSSYDMNIVDSGLYQIEELVNAFEECKELFNENCNYVNNTLGSTVNEFKSECIDYKGYLDEQFNEMKLEINQLRNYQYQRESNDTCQEKFDNIIAMLIKIKNSLVFIQKNKENDSLNANSCSQVQNQMNENSIVKNDNIINQFKAINPLCRRTRKRKLEELYY